MSQSPANFHNLKIRTVFTTKIPLSQHIKCQKATYTNYQWNKSYKLVLVQPICSLSNSLFHAVTYEESSLSKIYTLEVGQMNVRKTLPHEGVGSGRVISVF